MLVQLVVAPPVLSVRLELAVPCSGMLPPEVEAELEEAAILKELLQVGAVKGESDKKDNQALCA